METASTKVTSVWRLNGVEILTWKTHRYSVDFESQIHIKISTLNGCPTFHVDLPFKIDAISTNFPRGISTPNCWKIDKDVSIGMPFFLPFTLENEFFQTFWSLNTHFNEQFTVKHWEKKFGMKFLEGFSGRFCTNITKHYGNLNIKCVLMISPKIYSK